MKMATRLWLFKLGFEAGLVLLYIGKQCVKFWQGIGGKPVN